MPKHYNYTEKTGRPPKYTLEELKVLLQEFLDTPKSEYLGIPTKESLVHKLGITRETYNEWKKETHEFSYAIKEVENYIEAFITHLLITDNNPTGKIFYLKNAFGWRDKNETDITSGGKPIPIIPLK